MGVSAESRQYNGAAMRGLAARLNLQFIELTAAGVLILAGASFNIQGHTGRTGVLVMVGGMLAVAAGILHARWRWAVGLFIASIAVVVGPLPLEIHALREAGPAIGLNILGLAALMLGGTLGSLAYRHVLHEKEMRLESLEDLNYKLEEQHRIFLAATEEPTFLATDMEARARSAAEALGASFCAYYLATPDGKQFAPEGGGYGFEHVRPTPAQRGRADGLLGTIEAGQEFYTEERRDLSPLFRFFPPDFRILNALCAPIKVGDRVEGFILVGDKDPEFSEDDRRLVRTLATRAGIAFANVNAMELSQKEAGRYALLNELVREASGLTVDNALELVLQRGRELIDYEAGRVAVFQSDGTYHMATGSQVPAPIAGSPLEAVHREGRTVLRRATAADGLFSGLQLSEGAAASEAFVPIRGKGELFGALCLGRRGTAGFTDEDAATLEELGAIAGLAVENSRIVESYAGQATKLDSALDVLGEVSRALTVTGEGRRALEQEALKAAMRITGTEHGFLTRVAAEGNQRISTVWGFPREVGNLHVNAGQGIVGAVMLSSAPVALPDASDSFEMSSPPDLAELGLHGALCVPMLFEGRVEGTISVFSTSRREWTEDDIRPLSALGSNLWNSLKTAETLEASKKLNWELSNLHEGLRAVTSTLQLDEVLEEVLGWVAKASEAQIGCIALQEDGRLQLVGSYGSERETVERLALGLGGEICMDVMSSGEPAMDHMETDSASAMGTPLEPRAVMCVPLMLREQPIGVIFLANYVAGRQFTADHRKLVVALAAQAAVAIDNARLIKDREAVFLGALTALAQTVDERDPYTAGHSQRVTEYSLVIARHMGYAPGDEAAWQRLRQGTLLHDIGKIGIPDEILRKSDRLTPDEFDVMKRHPIAGYDILKNVKLLTDELVIVRSHHERYDGKGYPDGKRGDDLPLYAWIVSAADAFDAMTSDRPYRRALSLEMALSEITGGAGTHFHPLVAQAVAEAVEQGVLKVITSQSLYADAPVVGAFENPVR